MSTFPFPPSFEQRMRQQLVGRWESFAHAHEQTPPVSVRMNAVKKTDHLVNSLPLPTHSHSHSTPHPHSPAHIPWTSNGYYLSERPSFTLDPFFHAGAYYVQEASSMMLEQAVKQGIGMASGLRVLDLCAAPGGKSTHLLDLLDNRSLLVSNEVIRSRAMILSENILKWGHSNVIITNNDPEDFSKLKGYFDVVVVDAPCSGEGLFRKDVDAMKEWSIDNTHLCASRQRRIVSDIWPALKENALLIYSTCTYNAEENDENLRWIMQQWDAVPLKIQMDASWGVEETACGYQCFPHRLQGEGFYIAIVRKTTQQSAVRMQVARSMFTKVPSLTIPPATYLKSDGHAYVQFKDFLLALPQHLMADIDFLSSQLRVVSAGTTIGSIKHVKVIPDHALALSIYLNKENIPLLPVTKDEALTYLRKDVFWKEGLEKGFSIVVYDDMPLGWVNVLDNRLNNLYPAEWRIRMKT